MNRQIRKVAAAVGVLMVALFLNLNWVQVVKSDAYRNNPDNRRTLLIEYATPRGPIVVQGSAVASSQATDDELKYLRTYSDGPAYAPLTGYYSTVYGSYGLENLENPVLSGTDNRLLGSRITDLLTGRDAKGGRVDLTINKAAQLAAYSAMGNRPGAVVAIEPSTGRILAAVSTPSFDPNKLSSHDPDAIQAYWNSLKPSSSSTPLLNRAFAQTYPPGSVFKIIVSAAALKAGYTPSSVIPTPNKLTLPGTTQTLENFDGESCGNGRTDTLIDSFAISCNTAFAGLCLSDKIGQQKLQDQAALFGLDDQSFSTPLTVAGSTTGQIDYPSQLAQSCIGQFNVRITPIQGAMLAAAVANNGVLMKPYVVEDERAPDLSVLSTTKPQQQSQVLDPTLDSSLVQMMQKVVQTGTGTAANITDLADVTVGGKTGTADTGETDSSGKPAPPDAWFSGFASVAGSSKIAVAVILENGGVNGDETTGGLAAAPVAKNVMEAYLKSVGVK